MVLGVTSISILSRDPDPDLSRIPPKTWGNGDRFSERTMADKNGHPLNFHRFEESFLGVQDGWFVAPKERTRHLDPAYLGVITNWNPAIRGWGRWRQKEWEHVLPFQHG